jgi:hypothetical protein
VLVKYTKDKTIKELMSEVDKAHADAQVKRATLERERRRRGG